MTNAHIVELDSIPSMISMLGRAAFTRKTPASQPTFPPLVVRASGVRLARDKLDKFNAVCGFEPSNNIPMPYPHIMAFALHMQLMLHERFPFAPMGAVHVRNRIRQQRALRCDELLDFEVRQGAAEQVEKGYEVSLITEVRVAGELVWDDLSVMLIRKQGNGIRKEKTSDRATPEMPESVQWALAANKGREYAAASGDYNPIHLYPVTAKLMGFKRQIMHGMWSKSRTIAHLLPAEHEGPASVSVAFKLPIFLPGTVTLFYNNGDGQRCDFELKDAAGEKPHLSGQLSLTEGISEAG